MREVLQGRRELQKLKNKFFLLLNKHKQYFQITLSNFIGKGMKYTHFYRI